MHLPIEDGIMTGGEKHSLPVNHELQTMQTAEISVRPVEILGVRVHDVTIDEAVQLMHKMLNDGSPHHVVTVNPEFVMIARRHEEFRHVLANATLALPDGMGIVHAARLLGKGMRERVAGVDCVYRLATLAAERGSSMFLLGAAPGVAEHAGEVLKGLNPNLRIAGCYAGSPHPREQDTICRIVSEAAPDILLVAYGPPNQDLWIARTGDRLRVPLAIGVGGTFDFIAGVTRRAPVWVQKAGLEWLHRLINEPRRWKRMLTLPEFAVAVLWARLRKDPGRPDLGSVPK